jgi:hypothetical protein
MLKKGNFIITQLHNRLFERHKHVNNKTPTANTYSILKESILFYKKVFLWN